MLAVEANVPTVTWVKIGKLIVFISHLKVVLTGKIEFFVYSLGYIAAGIIICISLKERVKRKLRPTMINDQKKCMLKLIQHGPRRVSTKWYYTSHHYLNYQYIKKEQFGYKIVSQNGAINGFQKSCNILLMNQL